MLTKNKYNHLFRILVFLGLILLLTTYCKKDDNTNDAITFHRFVFNPSELFIDEDGRGFFEFTIDQPTEVEWQMESKPHWLNLDPQSGTLASGATQKIDISIGEHDIPNGSLLYDIVFSSNKTSNGRAKIRIKTGSTPSNYIGLMPDELVIPANVNDTSLLITNLGYNAFSFTITNIPEHMSLSATEGIVDPENPIQININIDRTGLDSIINVSSFLITNSLTNEKSLTTTIEKTLGDGLWKLPFLITDAEFSYSLNKFVAISSEDFALYNLDPINQTWSSISLPKAPLCISVSQDGHYAAVGHDAFCSYIDLINNELIDTYPITIKSYDIILAPNNLIHIFPEFSDNGGRSVNTETGNEIFSQGYANDYEYNFVRLHPDGQHIYGKRTNTSGNWFNKYDYPNDTLAILYDKSVSGLTYSVKKFWITKDGNKIYTQYRHVISSTDENETDLEYITSIEGEKNIKWFDDSPSKNLFCTIVYSSQSQWNGNEIITYNLNNNNPIDTVELPKYVGNIVYEPDGEFIYINSDGDKIWVLMHAEEDYPDPYSWGIIGFDL